MHTLNRLLSSESPSPPDSGDGDLLGSIAASYSDDKTVMKADGSSRKVPVPTPSKKRKSLAELMFFGGSSSSSVAGVSNSTPSSSTTEEKKVDQHQRARVELLQDLKRAIRTSTDFAAIRKEADPGTDAVDVRELDERDAPVQELCRALECCLWHGLRRHKRGEKTSGRFSMFSPSKKVPVTFFDFVSRLDDHTNPYAAQFSFSVRDVRELLFVHSAAGKGRAWIRFCLNRGILEGGLAVLMNDASWLQENYQPHSLLRCQEGSTIFLSLVAGLGGLNFQIHIDVETFDALPPPPRVRAFLINSPSPVPRAEAAAEIQASNDQIAAEAKALEVKLAKKNRSPTFANLTSAVSKFVRKRSGSWRSTSSSNIPAHTLVGLLGTPLESAVKSFHSCCLAHQDPLLGVPDVVVRCAALLLSDSKSVDPAAVWIHAAKVVSRASSDVKSAEDENAIKDIVDMTGRLERLSPAGLYVYADPSVDFQTALSKISATTKAGLLQKARRRSSRGFAKTDLGGVEIPSGNSDEQDTSLPIPKCRTIACVILLWLRMLPEPLVLDTLVSALLSCQGIEDDEARVRNLRNLLDTLPEHHKASFAFLIRFFSLWFPPSNLASAAKNSGIADVFFRQRNAQFSNSGAESTRLFSVIVSAHEDIFSHVLETHRERGKHLMKKRQQVLRCFSDAATPLNTERHTQLLRELWNKLSAFVADGKDDSFALVSRGWINRGFQGENVATDLRGASVKSVKDLIFFVEHYAASAQRIFAREISLEGISSYPVVMGSVQISRMVTQMLGIATLRQRSSQDNDEAGDEDDVEENDARVNSIAAQPFWALLRDPDAFEKVYCMAFMLFDLRWGQTNASAMDFNKLMRECRLLMLSLIETAPASIDDLWKLWMQQHGSEKDCDAYSTHGTKTLQRSFISMNIETEDDGGGKVKMASEKEDALAAKAKGKEATNPFLPELLHKSEILKDSHVADLEAALPPSYQGYNWERAFSLTGNGANIDRFYDIGAKHYATLLVVEDFEGNVFGGFAVEPWRIQSSYFGAGETFLFTFKDGPGKFFRWTGRNDFFMLANRDSLALGGGGGFGLYLDGDFCAGMSTISGTFANEVLASGEDFECANVELWSFVPKMRSSSTFR